jgi:hypothetical protein
VFADKLLEGESKCKKFDVSVDEFFTLNELSSEDDSIIIDESKDDSIFIIDSLSADESK